MRLDDDDLYDYDDEFDEDKAIEDVISALKPIIVSDIQAETELDKADWDIDLAISNLRKKLGKNKPSNVANSSDSKSNNIKAQKKLIPPQEDQGKGKLTPLQVLQKSRQEKNEKPKLSLADLASQRKRNIPSLSSIKKLKKQRTPINDSKIENIDSNSTINASKAEISFSNSWIPKISYDLSFSLDSFGLTLDNLASINTSASSLGGIISSSTQKSMTDTNYFEVPKQAQVSFGKPSPDDVVRAAQETAFTPNSKGKSEINVKQTPIIPKKTDQFNESKESLTVDKSGLLQKLQSLQIKPSCSFVVIGHVDAGKSTLMGRLLLETGSLSPKTVSKFERESAKAGKSSFWLAWALDATKEERERGVTVDISEAHFETDLASFTVLDAPGHKDYVPNMISGVSQADIALLVVDSDINAFESGFTLDGQTKEHAILARSLGMDHIIVAVNKMDTQGWNEERYLEIKSLLGDFLRKKVGFSKIEFVPTSGIQGTNVAHPISPDITEANWYSGPTLVQTLENSVKSESETDNTFRFMVSNAYVEPFQSTLTVTGRCISGVAEAGDSVYCIGITQRLEIKQVANKEFVCAGEQAELILIVDEQVKNDNAIKPGSILSAANDLPLVKTFEAKIRLFDLNRPIIPGAKLGFHMGRVDKTVKVLKILELLDAKNAADSKSRKIRHLGRGAAARVELELDTAEILTPPAVCKVLSRFVLRLDGETIGGGVVC